MQVSGDNPSNEVPEVWTILNFRFKLLQFTVRVAVIGTGLGGHLLAAPTHIVAQKLAHSAAIGDSGQSHLFCL